jgi:hypothetical protein
MAVLLDLHNHSAASYDASNRLDDYARAYAAGRFDVLAITDHNTIAGARELRAAAGFPVIVGEEVDTADGELIGLFLEESLPLDRPAAETAERIRKQGGLVYLQHPFYRLLRRPLRPEALRELLDRRLVDVVEIANGGPLMRGVPVARSIPLVRRVWGVANPCRAAVELARRHDLPVGAGSDAHHLADIGTCRIEVPGELPPELTPGWLLPSLRAGVVRDEHVRGSLATLAGRVRYAGRRESREPRRPPGSL